VRSVHDYSPTNGRGQLPFQAFQLTWEPPHQQARSLITPASKKWGTDFDAPADPHLINLFELEAGLMTSRSSSLSTSSGTVEESVREHQRSR